MTICVSQGAISRADGAEPVDALEARPLLAEHHDGSQTGRVDGCEALDQTAVGEHEARARSSDDVLEESAAVARVDRHVDGAEVIQREERRDGHRRVALPGQYEVALAHAKGLEPGGMPLDACQCLAVGPVFAVLEQHESGIGLLRRAPDQQLADDAFAGVREAVRISHAACSLHLTPIRKEAATANDLPGVAARTTMRVLAAASPLVVPGFMNLMVTGRHRQYHACG
jgi:hypothetical protein